MPDDIINIHVQCHQCGTVALIEEIYCFSCGVELKYLCQACGRESGHLLANYCPYCGSIISITRHDDIGPGNRSESMKEGH
jgi:rRNA maturation endonuclease Nob1